MAATRAPSVNAVVATSTTRPGRWAQPPRAPIEKADPMEATEAKDPMASTDAAEASDTSCSPDRPP